MFVFALIAAMVTFGPSPPGTARHGPHAFWPPLIALALAATATLALVIALGVFKRRSGAYLVRSEGW